MNAVASASRNRWTTTFAWLLRREFWENRGGFLWSQLIAGAIVIILSTVGAVIGVVQIRGNLVTDASRIDDASQVVRGLGTAGDAILATGFGLTSVVLAFVVFFYALGSLYDDRRDRSALFWKSLPVSDTQTVLSKAAWALVLAPLVAIVVGLAIGLALWAMAGLALLTTGLPHASALFTQAHPLRIIGQVLAILPLGLLWSLPAVGWLMFCSAWVRSKPFLWAVLLPFLACVMVSVLGAMPGLDLPIGQFWYVLVFRGLLSLAPGSWALPGLSERLEGLGDPADLLATLLGRSTELELYARADLWIGALVGIGFIAAAIYLRRWRDEA